MCVTSFSSFSYYGNVRLNSKMYSEQTLPFYQIRYPCFNSWASPTPFCCDKVYLRSIRISLLGTVSRWLFHYATVPHFYKNAYLTLSNTKWGTDLGMLVVPFNLNFPPVTYTAKLIFLWYDNFGKKERSLHRNGSQKFTFLPRRRCKSDLKF